MIEQLVAKNYGCLKDVTTPKMGMLHAFIGPNDSGKSTLLRAVRFIGEVVAGRFEQTTAIVPMDADVEVEVQVSGRLYKFERRGGGWSSPTLSPPVCRELRSRLVRFEPDALRAPSTLIADNDAIAFLDERGRGLPGVYDSIANRGGDAFAKIREQVTALFPGVKSLRLKAVSESERVLDVELRDGTLVPAVHMGEGLLYFLAFAALPYVSPTSIVLVEEPANGLHPARIAEVMTALRALSKSGTQVLLATHSPFIVNELAGDEITVVIRDESGTRLTLMKDTPEFEERAKIYALGELWVSYANGMDEGSLMHNPEGGLGVAS